jgi:hypothetical protein
MAILVVDCGSHQALENEDGDHNYNGPGRGVGNEQQWLDDEIERLRIRFKDWQEKPLQVARCRWARA